MSDAADHHRLRSEFIRVLVQQSMLRAPIVSSNYSPPVKAIAQYWHNGLNAPHDVKQCVDSWRRWETSGFSHQLFDEEGARRFILESLGTRYGHAFSLCYHPAMQADYFRLCYMLVKGGLYVDADDVCVAADIAGLFADGRLGLQPLCYDLATGLMVQPSIFTQIAARNPDWIFYFNNNPLIASSGHPVIKHALCRATEALEMSSAQLVLPEIQETTGPGNLSGSLFELFSTAPDAHAHLVVLSDWDSIAESRWPLSYRSDARNWRLSNSQRFVDVYE